MSSKLVPPKGQSFQTKQALVYHTLRDAIMQARLEPGERLVIDDIAKKLDVSPIPVREALQLLQSERLVEHKAHIGAIVSPITPESTREIFTLFEALESATFRLAVEYVTDADIKELTRLIERMDAVSENHEKWIELNLRFHHTCAEIARMPRALEMLIRVSGEWERLRRHCYLHAGKPDTAAAHREHRGLVEALAQKDSPRLESLVREHNRSAMAFYLAWEAKQTQES